MKCNKKSKKKQDKCTHKNQYLKVIDTICTCEITVIACYDCGKYLTEPETEC